MLLLLDEPEELVRVDLGAGIRHASQKSSEGWASSPHH